MKHLIFKGFIILVCLLGQLAYAIELRPGDILKIKFPGENEFNNNFQLDSQGRITLPEIGAVTLQGKSIKQTRKALVKRLKTVFKDLSKFRVSLHERRLIVTVLGYVKRPGSVDLPDKSNVQMAINIAGGLSQGAQLNKLQIRRKGSVIEFDYKRYLDSGNLKSLPALQPMDVIFIPASPLLGNVQVDIRLRFNPVPH